MTRYEKIKSALDEMSTAELVNVHNAYCDAANYMDDYIYSMDDFDEIMSGQSPWEIARCAFYGDFCPAHDYFWFNGYANLCSADYRPEIINTEDIAKYIDENDDDLGDADLAEILDDEEDEEDGEGNAARA